MPKLTVDGIEVEVAPGTTVLEAARLAVTLRRTGAEHLERLRAGLVPELPVLYVPELFRHSVGLRALAQVADALGAELGG
jgi:hypothetical protein